MDLGFGNLQRALKSLKQGNEINNNKNESNNNNRRQEKLEEEITFIENLICIGLIRTSFVVTQS